MAEDTKAEASERQDATQEIVELREAQSQALPAATKELEAAVLHFEKTHKDHLKSTHRLKRARAEVLRINFTADIPVARLEQMLRDSARSGIAEFLDWLHDVTGAERLKFSFTATPFGARLEQLRAVRAQAERLVFEPDPEVAEGELDRLRGEVAMPQDAVA